MRENPNSRSRQASTTNECSLISWLQAMFWTSRKDEGRFTQTLVMWGKCPDVRSVGLDAWAGRNDCRSAETKRPHLTDRERREAFQRRPPPPLTAASHHALTNPYAPPHHTSDSRCKRYEAWLQPPKASTQIRLRSCCAPPATAQFQLCPATKGATAKLYLLEIISVAGATKGATKPLFFGVALRVSFLEETARNKERNRLKRYG
jgi:hypothetical protein